MPLYEYECKNCASQFELLRARNAQEPPICPVCGQTEVVRVMSSFRGRLATNSGSLRSIAGTSSCAGCSATSCAACRN